MSARCVMIRERLDSDFATLGDVARRVHESDGYPIYLPNGDVDRFLKFPQSSGAWVATVDGVIVGHVALNFETSAPVMQVVRELDEEASILYVARLLVDPGHRRTGAGRALLEHASQAALAAGARPVLDVVDIPTAAPAIALYRAAGWEEIARVSFELADTELTEIVFAGPISR